MLNKKLARIHMLLAIPYAIFFGIMVIFSIIELHKNGDVHPLVFSFLFGTLAALHFFAMVGVRKGLNSGKSISRFFGIVFIYAFPIGTLLGVYILKLTKNFESITLSKNESPL